MCTSVKEETHSRRFSHYKFALLLIMVLNCELHLRLGGTMYRAYFENDLKFCRSCFEHQINDCMPFIETIEMNSQPGVIEFITNFMLPYGSDRSQRHSRILEMNNNGYPIKMVGKYYGYRYPEEERKKFDSISNVFARLLYNDRNNSLESFQLCPGYAIERFVQYFQRAHKEPREHMVGLYMLYDIQLLLLPELYRRGFPVSEPLAICGFGLFERFAGKPLWDFYGASIQLRLEIARQLLQIALNFTNGFDDYRFYITDLTADNLVYDMELNKLYLVDLNTLFIVDTRGLRPYALHKHIYIECDDCFAYSPQDLCAYSRSDLNIFAVCQFLRENLRRDRTRGFLHSVPESMQRQFPQLLETLDMCVDCPEESCENRLEIASDLINIFIEILYA